MPFQGDRDLARFARRDVDLPALEAASVDVEVQILNREMIADESTVRGCLGRPITPPLTRSNGCTFDRATVRIFDTSRNGKSFPENDGSEFDVVHAVGRHK